MMSIALLFLRKFIMANYYQRLFKSNDGQIVIHILCLTVKFTTNMVWLYFLALLVDPGQNERTRLNEFKQFVNTFTVTVVGGLISRLMTFYIVWCYVRAHFDTSVLQPHLSESSLTVSDLVSSYQGGDESVNSQMLLKSASDNTEQNEFEKMMVRLFLKVDHSFKSQLAASSNDMPPATVVDVTGVNRLTQTMQIRFSFEDEELMGSPVAQS
jgi:hypothetical protein